MEPTTPIQPSSTPATPPPPADVIGPPDGGNPIIKILKIVGIVVVVLLIIFFVVGFIRSKLSNKNANQKVTLQYWGLWEDKSVMQPLLDEFHKENPNITVEYSKQDINQYTDRLLTRLQNGTGPDVFRFHDSWLPFLSSSLVPLPKDVIAAADFQKYFYPVARRDLVSGGAIYGIPLEIDTLSLYTNTDMFTAAGENPPVTWDDFKRIAKELTIKDADTGKIKTAGAAMGTYDNITHAPDIISLLFAQSGVDVNKLGDNASNASIALKFYTDFAQTSGGDNVWDATLDPSELAFAKGNLAMYLVYSWDYFAIKAINPDLNFKITPVPHLPGQSSTIASYWAEGVSSHSTHQPEALLFMQFLAKKETAQLFYTTAAKTRLFGEPYARTDLASLLKSNPVVYPFVQQGLGATSSFFADSTYGKNDVTFNSRMNQYLGDAVRSVLSNTSTDTAITTLIQGVSQVLAQPIQHGQ